MTCPTLCEIWPPSDPCAQQILIGFVLKQVREWRVESGQEGGFGGRVRDDANLSQAEAVRADRRQEGQEAVLRQG